jgi:hypothetical protein
MASRKPVIHGGSSARTLRPDPRPDGSGSGIEFDTYPQSGNWLYAATSSSDANTSGYGILLVPSDGLSINTPSSFTVFADSGIGLTTSSGNLNLTASGSGHAINLTAQSQVNLLSDYGTVTITSSLLKIQHFGENVEVDLASTKKLIVKGSGGSSFFEVRDDGTVHIKTGGSVVADL